jgi:enoyl-CoA hydratase/carnithine racemase
MGNLVDYTTDRGVAIITLRDPPINSYTLDMINEFDDAITDARFDEDVSVLVITGYGENFFSAGANIKMLREVDATFRYNFFLAASEALNKLEQTSKLTVAAINGHAVGGGLEIALACDIRIARKNSGTVGLPELDLGLMPSSGGTQRLVRTIGKARALQMIVECEKLSFEQALEFGLVNYVWNTSSHAEFMENVLAYAHRFTLPNKAVLAVGKAKRAIQAALEMPIEQGQAFERELLAQLCRSADAAEGIDAWIEKRDPVFQGK